MKVIEGIRKGILGSSEEFGEEELEEQRKRGVGERWDPLKRSREGEAQSDFSPRGPQMEKFLQRKIKASETYFIIMISFLPPSERTSNWLGEQKITSEAMEEQASKEILQHECCVIDQYNRFRQLEVNKTVRNTLS